MGTPHCRGAAPVPDIALAPDFTLLIQLISSFLCIITERSVKHNTFEIAQPSNTLFTRAQPQINYEKQ